MGFSLRLQSPPPPSFHPAPVPAPAVLLEQMDKDLGQVGPPAWVSNVQGPGGARGHKASVRPPFLRLQETAFLQPPRPSLSSNGQIQTVVN